jgi:membrane associated rhomboid family serine protease
MLCAISAGPAQTLTAPDPTGMLVGATGAIAGMLGAYRFVHPRVTVVALRFRRIPVLLPAYLLIGAWLLVQLFGVWWGRNDPIAWWAQIGGFVAGAWLVVSFRDKRAPLFDGGLRR